MEVGEDLLREEVVLGVVYLVFSPCKEKTKETQEEKKSRAVPGTEITSRILYYCFCFLSHNRALLDPYVIFL